MGFTGAIVSPNVHTRASAELLTQSSISRCWVLPLWCCSLWSRWPRCRVVSSWHVSAVSQRSSLSTSHAPPVLCDDTWTLAGRTHTTTTGHYRAHLSYGRMTSTRPALPAGLNPCNNGRSLNIQCPRSVFDGNSFNVTVIIHLYSPKKVAQNNKHTNTNTVI